MLIEKCSNITMLKDFSSMLPWYIMVFITSMVVILSFICLVLILVVEKFRAQKEYVLVAASLAHEFAHSISQLILSSTKVATYWKNEYMPMTTRAACFQILFPLVIVFTGSGLMTLVFSIDRLLSVIIPIRYLTLSRNYSLYLTIGGYLLALPVLLISIFIIANEEYGGVEIQGICEFSITTYPIINEMTLIVRAGTTFLGILLYIPITWKLKQAFLNNGKNSFKDLSAAQRNNLIRYNTTVSLMVLNELLLIIFPDIILIVWPTVSFKRYLFDVVPLKGFTNILIIVCMQKDLRNYYLRKIFKKLDFNKNNVILFQRNGINVSNKMTNFEICAKAL